MCERVSQFVRWKENLATALKLRSWTYARYSDGWTFVLSVLSECWRNINESRTHSLREIQILDCFVISASLTVLIIGGNFEREIVKMTIERTWCIGIGLFGFYFYWKWCLIDWNQVYDEWQLDWIFYESIDFCRLSGQSRE